jgi:ATP-dependent DNA helicase RecQ
MMTKSEIADRKQAQQWLQTVAGKNATFHPEQWESVYELVENNRKLLVVQRTGWGKSLVYFLATKLLRKAGRGPTILISPLLSLMRDQVRSATLLGIEAVTLNSTNSVDHDEIEQKLNAGQIDLLLISPERLANKRFYESIWRSISSTIGLMVIDEAHCISDWGHDFRPNYRRIMHVLDDLETTIPVLATTATATDRVVDDVSEILGGDVHIIRGPLTRRSLHLYNYREPMSSAYRLALLSKLLERLPGSGIIYCSTTRDCIKVSGWLSEQGHKVKPYYGRVESELGLSREKLERDLLENNVKALVASVALGMGFDKPDLSFVVHYQHPGSIVGYYQQIGRAGRGINDAWVILLHGQEDVEIQTHFIETAFPKREDVDQVIDILHKHGDLKRYGLEKYVNGSRSTIEKILTHLEVEGMVVRDGTGTYSLSGEEGQLDYDRWQSVTEKRYAELEQMREYIHHKNCLMQYIAAVLDDPSDVVPCESCRNCRGNEIKTEPSATLVEEARLFLSEGELVKIEPRKRWPSGLDQPWVGKIKPLNELGYALCYYYDDGYGRFVREGKYKHQNFDGKLVLASAEMLLEVIGAGDIQWVTSVPSHRHPDLVPDFAARLAGELKLPFVDAIHKQVEHPPQKEMNNSYQQVDNLIGAFRVDAEIPEGGVLLVDDMVDSRWTFTVLGALLYERGCEAVFPFALATTS